MMFEKMFGLVLWVLAVIGLVLISLGNLCLVADVALAIAGGTPRVSLVGTMGAAVVTQTIYTVGMLLIFRARNPFTAPREPSIYELRSPAVEGAISLRSRQLASQE